jgi:hypothetical protein
MEMPIPICRKLLMHRASCPRSFPAASDGNSMLAKIPMIEITTSNSISVNPRARFKFGLRHLIQ